MKYPFNKERAMKGEPVVTRDGRKAEYRSGFDDEIYTMVFVIEGEGGDRTYTSSGKWIDGEDNDRDLFMLTPDHAPSAPIPFDWDKYNSGEWDAVYRDGPKIKALHNISEMEFQPILSIASGNTILWHHKGGEFLKSKTIHNLDLLLTPKQVTRWFNLYKDHNGRLSVSASFDSEPTAKQADYVTGYIGTYSFTTNAKP